MTWRIAVIAVLALVVIGGIVWYERTRPSSRMVALVAALAALAVAGRLAFAPFPNVVATTDIALITGFALGAAPGFAVGALAAPVSNIWLGQGPWTPWQMAGWGLVGLAGAALAVITGRRVNRWTLAIACALAGLAYGALLDLYTMVDYGGEQSLDRYLALSARAIPFNVAHAAGNFAIALAAGPALVRMISRYRTRLEFNWAPSASAAAAVLIVLVVPAMTPSLTDPPEADAKRSIPAEYLIRAQNDDGGYAAAAGQPSNPAMTGWAMLGLEAAGINPLDVGSDGRTPVDYLEQNTDRLQSVGDLERTVLALEGAGLDAGSFAGRDLVAQLRKRRDGDGSVDGQVNLTAFYILALRSAGVPAGDLGKPAKWLREAQAKTGGWGIQPQAPAESDSTGAVLQALASVGGSGPALEDGAGYLRKSQTGNGGFAIGTSGVVNSQSTAWAIQGLAAAGSGGDTMTKADSYMNSVRASDGHYRYSASSDQTPIWVTAQALLATNHAPFPLTPVPRTTPEAAATDPPEEPQGSPAESPTVDSVSSGRDSSDGGSVAGASGERSGRSGSGGAGDEDGSQGDKTAEEPASAVEESVTTPSAPAVMATTAAATAAAEGGEEDAASWPWVLGGFAALALALGAGFLWYRRRLP